MMYNRGEIYQANLSPIAGHEQAGRRPVLIVSSNAVNRYRGVVTIVPGTTNVFSVSYEGNVHVSARETGLPHDTVFLCTHVRSIDPIRFTDPETGETKRIGTMPEEKMDEIDLALRFVLEL